MTDSRTGGPDTRRLLVVSYHFGANCGTGGFRWNATADHLCAAGWHVDVVTAARPGLRPDRVPSGPGALEIFPVTPTRAPTRLKESLLKMGRWLRALLRPAGTSERVDGDVGGETVNPEQLFVWRTGYRRSLREMILHAIDYLELAASELVWAHRALVEARRLAADRRYRAVVVSTPPHLTQRVGIALARELGLPYVADYRDPWTLGMGRHIGWVNEIERIAGRRVETRSLRSAHTVVHNTERARVAIAADFPIPGRHYAIPNGYDATTPVGAPDPDCFRIAYTGHLYSFMDLRPLLAACARLRCRHALSPGRMRIDFLGTEEQFESVALKDLAAAYGLRDVFTRHPRLPRGEAAGFQQRAAVLVAYDWIYPIAVVSKFYEYTRMRGSLLLLGNPDSALGDAAAKLGLPVLDARDERSVDASLEAAFARWSKGEFERPVDSDGVFARLRQSERILEVLEGIP